MGISSFLPFLHLCPYAQLAERGVGLYVHTSNDPDGRANASCLIHYVATNQHRAE